MSSRNKFLAFLTERAEVRLIPINSNKCKRLVFLFSWIKFEPHRKNNILLHKKCGQVNLFSFLIKTNSVDDHSGRNVYLNCGVCPGSAHETKTQATTTACLRFVNNFLCLFVYCIAWYILWKHSSSASLLFVFVFTCVGLTYIYRAYIVAK